jgi:lysophospholipase L1-like esterase
VPFARFFAYVGYTIFSVILGAVLIEIGATLLRSAYHRGSGNDAEGMAGSPPYQGYAWAKEFWKEEYERRETSTGHRYVPFLIWGERAWHSSTINVDESAIGNLRRTVNPSNAGCDAKQRRVVWMFGGSTLFGMGVPDMETIPSHVSKELKGAGQCVEVVNLGMEGYLTNQELILLMEALKSGQHPDVVVFYDGVNEAYAAAAPGIPGKPTPHLEYESIKGRMEGSFSGALDFLRDSNAVQLARAVVGRFGRRSESSVPASGEQAARAGATLDNYQANVRVLRKLAEAYNFKVLFFWQPSLASGNKPLTPFEEQFRDELRGSPQANTFAMLEAVNDEAERRSQQGGDYTFLGRIFDTVEEPVYIDHLMHLGPHGNEIVAKAIAQAMEGQALN